MSACIDTNPATDALAEILYELIELNEGGMTCKKRQKKSSCFSNEQTLTSESGRWRNWRRAAPVRLMLPYTNCIVPFSGLRSALKSSPP